MNGGGAGPRMRIAAEATSSNIYTSATDNEADVIATTQVKNSVDGGNDDYLNPYDYAESGVLKYTPRSMYQEGISYLYSSYFNSSFSPLSVVGHYTVHENLTFL